MTATAGKVGWTLAVIFAATTALFTWQYAQARRAADKVRQDYESLQIRVEAQAAQNKEFDATLRALQQQLHEARSALETLDRAVNAAPQPPAQPEAAPQP